MKKPSLRIYAAGKVEKNGWRKSIGIGEQIACDLEDLGFSADCTEAAPSDIRLLQNLETEIQRGVYYVGPFAISCDHGCYHGIHGCSAYPFDDSEADPEFEPTAEDQARLQQRLKNIRRAVHENAKAQIEKCTHFFAWLDDPTAFGTISEIGYAAGLGKPIYLATPPDAKLDNLWFCQNFATVSITTNTAQEAWTTFLATIQKK